MYCSPGVSSRYRLTETGSLVIREVERSDAATYTCRAENIVAVRDSGVARLSVHSEYNIDPICTLVCCSSL